MTTPKIPTLKAPKAAKSSPIPLRLPDEMKSKVSTVAEKSGLSEADIMRLSIERGIAAVEKMFSQPDEQAA